MYIYAETMFNSQWICAKHVRFRSVLTKLLYSIDRRLMTKHARVYTLCNCKRLRPNNYFKWRRNWFISTRIVCIWINDSENVQFVWVYVQFSSAHAMHAKNIQTCDFQKKCHFKSVAIHPNNKKPYQLYTYSETIINFSSFCVNYVSLWRTLTKLGMLKTCKWVKLAIFRKSVTLKVLQFIQIIRNPISYIHILKL